MDNRYDEDHYTDVLNITYTMVRMSYTMLEKHPLIQGQDNLMELALKISQAIEALDEAVAKELREYLEHLEGN